MDNRFKFRAINKQTKEITYIDSFYWFEENGVSEIDHNNTGSGVFAEYWITLSTGLKDKNGKLIFEGDIVKGKDHFYRDRLCEITYSSIYCCFFIVGDKWSDECLFNLNDKEVIGNVYTDADLLKGEQCQINKRLK